MIDSADGLANTSDLVQDKHGHNRGVYVWK